MAEPFVEALLYSGGAARLNAGAAGTAATASYRFLDALPANYTGAPESKNFARFSATQEAAALAALSLWSEVANLTFTPSSDAAQIQFGTFSDRFTGAAAWAYPPLPENGQQGSDVWLNNAFSSNTQLNPDQYGFFTLLHELGHALGLKHPGNYNALSGGPLPPSPFLLPAEDSEQFTVMSYHEHGSMWVHASTPMLYDIAAMQFLYGAKASTRAGDSTYSRTELGEVFLATIWDGGGIDTIDASGWTNAAGQPIRALIDLRAGQFSSLGPNGNGGDALNNLAIAFGVAIENAKGGAGADRIIGNDGANKLEGEAGADVILGGGAADELVGGAGDDQLSGGAGSDKYTFATSWGRDLISADGTTGDTVEFSGIASAGFAPQIRQGTDLLLSAGTDALTIRDYFTSPEGTEHLNWAFKTADVDLVIVTDVVNFDPGETRDSARGLGILNPSSGQLTSTTGDSLLKSTDPAADDQVDYFRFTLSTFSTVSLALTPAGGNADLRLENEAGATIASSLKLSTAVDSLDRELAAGTYFARVSWVSAVVANTPVTYTFAAAARSKNTPNNLDDVRTGANDLEVIDHIERSANDFVSGRTLPNGAKLDPRDFYKFTLAGIATVTATLDNLSANADLQLLNAQGGLIQARAAAGTAAETIVRDLADGTYFLNVFVPAGSSAETNYRLTVSASTISVDAAPNTRALVTEAPFVLDSRARIFSDWVIGSTDANDFYRFSIVPRSGARFSLTLDQLAANADVQLLRGNGTVLYTGAKPGLADETLVNRALTPGEYFVRVYPASGSAKTSYRLTLSAAEIVDRAPASIGTADERLRRITDSVGALDRTDRVQFDVRGTSRLSVAGQAAGAAVRIRDSVGRLVANISTRVAAGAEAIWVDGIELASLGTLSLAEGTYFLEVVPEGTNEVNYTLALSASEVSSHVDEGPTRQTAFDLDVLDQNERVLRDRFVSGRLLADGIARLDLADFYRFTLTEPSDFSLTLDELSANQNVDVQLLTLVAGLPVVIASGAKTGNQAETLALALNPSEYFIRVFAVGTSETNYRLTVKAPPVSGFPDAGNTRAQAQDLEKLDDKTLVLDRRWVSARLDANDFYKIELKQASNVTLTLDGLEQNADLQLQDAAGVLLATSARFGVEADTLNRSLAPGFYYVRVVAAAGAETNYRLTLAAQTIAADLAGNTPETANDLGKLDGRGIEPSERVIAKLDPNDYYKFTLDAASTQLTLGLSGLTANADVQLLDANRRLLAQSIQLGSLPESIVRSVPAGTYYVRVLAGVNADTPYDLTLAAVVTSAADGAGNTRAAARDIGVLDREHTLQDRVSGQLLADGVTRLDSNDFYKFTLAAPSRVTVGLSGLSANADVQLLNGAGTVIASSLRLAAADESIAVNNDVAAGIYFVRVFAVGAAETNYTLTLNGVLSDGNDNTIARARAISGAVPGSFTVSDRVGPLDPTDFYQLTLTTTARVTFALTGLVQDADVAFYDSSGRRLTILKEPDASQELLGVVVPPGTYYAQVLQVAGETPYTLTVSRTAATDIDRFDRPVDLPALGETPVVRSDRVGDFDDEDSFRFTLAAPARIDFFLSGLSQDADLSLNEVNGHGVSSFRIEGATDERVLGILDAGTYEVGVRLEDETLPATSYTLSLSALPLAADIDSFPGNPFVPFFLNLTNAPRQLQDEVGPTDSDFYNFSINPGVFPAGVTLTISVSGVSQDVALRLFQVIGTTSPQPEIASANNVTGPGGETLSLDLVPGQYFFQIDTVNATAESSYTVNVSVASRGGDLAGDTRALAQDAGTLTATATVFQNGLGFPDVSDFYRFTVSQRAPIELTLQNLGGLPGADDLDLWLYDSEGRLLALSKTEGLADERILRFVDAGTYYAEILFGEGDSGTRYTLSLGLATVSGAGDNSLAGANLVTGLSTTPTTRTGTVDEIDVLDLYRFDLAATATVTTVLFGLTADADLYLLDVNGDPVDALANSENEGIADESVTRTLTTGTYFVAVAQFEGIANYTLSLTSLAAGTDNALNTPEQARPVGVLGPTPITFSDQVSVADDTDFYSFTLGSVRPVAITVSGLTADANLWLLDSEGGLIDASNNAGTGSETISVVLDPGTYFAEVWWGFGDIANYSISFVSQDVAPDTAGATLATARDLGALGAASIQADEQIGTLDALDAFRFSLAATREVTIQLDLPAGAAADADLALLDSTGGAIKFSANDGNFDEAVRDTLAAGTYYVVVAQFDGDTAYTLTLSTQGDTNDQAGNTAATARVVPALTEAPQSFTDSVSFLDDTDLYKFILDAQQRVTVAMTGLTNDADLELLKPDSQGGLIPLDANAFSAESGTTSESIVRLLGAGTYFAEVQFYSDPADYTIAFAAVGSGGDGDPAGNTPAAAQNIASLPFSTAGRVTVQIDDNDYYKFTLTQNARVTITLSGLADDADVRLLRSDGTTEVSRSERYGIELDSAGFNEFISEVLDPGTYFVDVYQFDGDTAYSLAISSETAAGDTAGNSVASALAVTEAELRAGKTITERVSTIDKDDYYSFILTSKSSFSLALTGLTDDADVELLAADGTTMIAFSANVDTQAETLGKILDPGTYFVHVEPFEDAETNYTLTLAAGALPGGLGLANETWSGTLAATGMRSNETLGALPNLWSGIRSGGAGNDTYVTAANAVLAVADGGGGEDTLQAAGIGFARATTWFAAIENRHLLMWDSASREAALLIDWQQMANRIEDFRLGGVRLNAAAFAEALDRSVNYLRNAGWEQLGMSSDMAAWSLAGTNLFELQRPQMQAIIAAANP